MVIKEPVYVGAGTFTLLGLTVLYTCGLTVAIILSIRADIVCSHISFFVVAIYYLYLPLMDAELEMDNACNNFNYVIIKYHY